MIFVLLLVIIIGLLLSLMYYKTKSEQIENEAKKSSSIIEDLEIDKSDEKLISKIFSRKITRTFLGAKQRKYSFTYKKDEYCFGGCNTDYDVIKTEINKLSINGEILFNVEFKAWIKLLDYKKEQTPDTIVTNIVSNPETLNEQVNSNVNNLFKKINNELENEINIETY